MFMVMNHNGTLPPSSNLKQGPGAVRVAFKDTCSAAARPSRAATVGAGKGKEAHRPAFSRSGLTLLMQWSSIVVGGRNQPDMAHRTLHVTGVVASVVV